MPEEITHEPESYQLVKDIGPPKFTSKLAEAVLIEYEKQNPRSIEIPFERIKSIIPSIEDGLANLYPGIPRHQIEQFKHLYFGPYMLNFETVRGEITHDLEQKVLSASMQHMLAHSILYASNPNAEESFTKKVFTTAVVHDNIARGMTGKGDGITTNWNGVLAEVGIIRVLQSQKFDVFLPNYTGNGKSVDHEVQTWDVQNGVDLVAVTPSVDRPVAILIDAKGQYKYPKDDYLNRQGLRIQADVTANHLSNKDIRSLPYSLQKFLSQIKPEEVYRSKIIIPTGQKHLMSLQDAYLEWEGDSKGALSHFAEVSQEVEDRIAKSLNILTQPISMAV